MCSTVSAVSWETTRSGAGRSAGTSSPRSSVVPATMLGVVRTPPFAIVEKTLVAWIAFTDTLWPKSTAYSVRPSHESAGCRMPADSPGSPRPDFWPKPNFRR